MKSKGLTVFLCLTALVIGAFLRGFKLDTLMVFTGDQGRDFLITRDLILGKNFPLFGPPTSLSWFKLGPFIYYFWSPFLLLGKFNPLSLGYLSIAIDIAAIFAMFYLLLRNIDLKTALVGAFLYAACPFAILHSRMPLHVNLSAFFTILSLILLTEYLRSKKNIYFFILCFILGVFIQIHLTAIILIGVFFAFLYKKIKINYLLIGLFVFLFPLIPFLIGDSRESFVMSGKIITWFPYRLLSAFGFLTSKNILSANKILNVFSIIIKVANEIVYLPNRTIALIVLIILILCDIIMKRKCLLLKITNWLLAAFIISFFLHGEPSEHYFVIILPLVIIIESISLRRRFLIPLVIFLILANTIFLPNNNYFSQVSLGEEIATVREIINDSGGKDYQIETPSDIVNLPGYYRQYQYLGWWLGHEPSSNAQGRKYIIYERKKNLTLDQKHQVVKELEHIVIVRAFN